jgi:hypothetical protein
MRKRSSGFTDEDKANTAIRRDQFSQGLRADCPDLAQEFGTRAKLFERGRFWFLFQERIDAENSEIVEWLSGALRSGRRRLENLRSIRPRRGSRDNEVEASVYG